MRPLTSQLGQVRWKWHVGTNGQKATISPLSARSKLKNRPSPPWSCIIAGHREVHQEKFHISINTSPRAAQSWNQPISKFWAFWSVILHFAPKLFTAVPNFWCHRMRVSAAYKKTKNQINRTTHITAGSCYREVRWKWHVGTNQWRVQDFAEGGGEGGLWPGSRRDGVGVDDIMLLSQVSHFENRCQEAPPVAPFFNSYSPERPQRLFRRISAPHGDKCRTCFKFPFFVGLRDDRPWCFGEAFSGALSPLI